MPKLWLEPNVCAQGSQSTSTGGSSLRKASASPSMAWLEHSMRWVLVTALGKPVEPEVSRNLAIESGPTAARADSAAEEIGRSVRWRTASRRGPRRCRRRRRSRFRAPSPCPRRGRRRARPRRKPVPASGDRARRRACPNPAKSANRPSISGTSGAPTAIPASESSAWSMLLPDRISAGLSSDRPRASSAAPICRIVS